MACPASCIAVSVNGCLSTGRAWLARRLDGVPDPLWGRRHVEMCDAVGRQRVDHCVHHRGGGGDGADLAAPLDAERIVPTTGALRGHRDWWSGHPRGACDNP